MIRLFPPVFFRPQTFSSKTTVEIGTQYENTVISSLKKHLGMDIKPSPPGPDGGIDFAGTWNPGNFSSPFSIIGQCKHESKSIGIKYMREFESLLSRFPSETIGTYVSTKGFTPQAIQYIGGQYGGHKTTHQHNWKISTLLDKTNSDIEITKAVLLVTLSSNGSISNIQWNGLLAKLFEPKQLQTGRVYSKTHIGQKEFVLAVDGEPISARS